MLGPGPVQTSGSASSRILTSLRTEVQEEEGGSEEGLPTQRLVKRAEQGRVFEAPEAETQQKVWVSEEGAAAWRRRTAPTCWSPAPRVSAAAERDARL